jgi:phage terminase large subunit-like protein
MAIRSILKVNPWIEARLDVQRDRVVCPDTGSELHIITTDALSTHGSRPDVVILNEATHCDDEAFAQTLWDNLSKMPFALGIVLTNAGLLGSWQHVWKKIAVDSPDVWKVHEVKEPPPWISKKEIEQAKLRNSHSRFMRLYYGVWSSGSGEALDEADIQAAIDPRLAPQPCAELGWSYVAGLDLGIRNDHSAVVTLGYKPSTLEIRLVDCESWAPNEVTGQVDLIAVQHYILALHKRFALQVINFDTWQAHLLSQQLSVREVNPYIFTGKLRCGRCGALLHGVDNAELRYRCKGHRHGECTGGTNIREDKIFSVIADFLERQLEDTEGFAQPPIMVP